MSSQVSQPVGTRRARVVTVSDRAAAGVYADRSGPVLVRGLAEMGFEVGEAEVVPDGQPVRAALVRAIDAGVDLVVTCGGTGLAARDLTPELTAALIDRPVPGIAELLRRAEVPAAALSRGVSGLARRTLVINVAGSVHAAEHACRVLADLLPHAMAQLAGHDH